MASVKLPQNGSSLKRTGSSLCQRPAYRTDVQVQWQSQLIEHTRNKSEQKLDWQRLVEFRNSENDIYFFIKTTSSGYNYYKIETQEIETPQCTSRCYMLHIYNAVKVSYIWAHLLAIHFVTVFCLHLSSLQQNVTDISVDGNDELCKLFLFFQFLFPFSTPHLPLSNISAVSSYVNHFQKKLPFFNLVAIFFSLISPYSLPALLLTFAYTFLITTILS